MALVGVEREPLVLEPDALTTRPPPLFLLKKLVTAYYSACTESPKGLKSLETIEKRVPI